MEVVNSRTNPYQSAQNQNATPPSVGSGRVSEPGMSSEPDAQQARTPYGYGLTTIFAIVAIIVNLIASNLIAMLYVAYKMVLNPGLLESQTDLMKLLAGSGTIMGLSVMVGSVATVLFLMLVILLRRGPALLDYLRLGKESIIGNRSKGRLIGLIVLWSATFFGFVFATDYILTEIIKIQEPEFMRMMACAPDPLGFLLVASIIVGPVFEEILVRGFWMRSLEGRSMRFIIPAGFILPNLVWAALHGMQYDVYLLGQIFLMGLVLSAIRWHMKSLWLPIILHVSNNAIAMFSNMYSDLDCSAYTLMIWNQIFL